MESILNYLKDFKGKQGLYIIRPKSQEILKLIYLKGFTYDEVAIMYNVSRQAINNTANKCLKKLKQTATTNV